MALSHPSFLTINHQIGEGYLSESLQWLMGDAWPDHLRSAWHTDACTVSQHWPKSPHSGDGLWCRTDVVQQKSCHWEKMIPQILKTAQRKEDFLQQEGISKNADAGFSKGKGWLDVAALFCCLGHSSKSASLGSLFELYDDWWLPTGWSLGCCALTCKGRRGFQSPLLDNC